MPLWVTTILSGSRTVQFHTFVPENLLLKTRFLSTLSAQICICNILKSIRLRRYKAWRVLLWGVCPSISKTERSLSAHLLWGEATRVCVRIEGPIPALQRRAFVEESCVDRGLCAIECWA